ncbi:MAG: ABC transporter ATP-binding protein [Fibrobacterota bacterium]
MILKAQGISTSFDISSGLLRTGKKGVIHAVKSVDLTLGENETLAIVGESGCGKSTLARTLLRLTEPTAGTIHLLGTDITTLSQRKLRHHRKHMQIIFQNALSSLNPRFPVIKSVMEPLEIHTHLSPKKARSTAAALLERVGIEKQAHDKLPHQFSGGQCQRIAMARALALRPKFIIADEAVSALDVSVQAQILNLLGDIQKEYGLSYIFISHDLAVVNQISDRIMVMYLGEILEQGTTARVITEPEHPYTKMLLHAVPALDTPGRRQENIIAPPTAPHSRSGCLFYNRCPMRRPDCRDLHPQLEKKQSGKYIRCHYVD